MLARKHFVMLLLVAALLAGTATLVVNPTDADAAGNGPPATLMTRNLYLGADLAPIFAAATPEELQAAVTLVAGQAFASDIPTRAAAVAEEIIAYEPHLVGLQESAVWTFGPMEVNFAQIIVAQLAARGFQYQIIAVATGFDQSFGTVGLAMNDVILARADLPADKFSLANVQTGNYAAFLPLPSPIGTIVIPRQWASVDVALHGKSFRFISTHLESYDGPPVGTDLRMAQAWELLQIANASPLPVVLMGDLNAELDIVGDAAWFLTTQGGFADAWSNSQNDGPGFTCCQDPSLRVPDSLLHERIDFIMTRGGFSVINAHLVGTEWIADPADPAMPVLWASDHAGVVAKLFLPIAAD